METIDRENEESKIMVKEEGQLCNSGETQPQKVNTQRWREPQSMQEKLPSLVVIILMNGGGQGLAASTRSRS